MTLDEWFSNINSVMNLLGQSLHFKKPRLSRVDSDAAAIFHSRFGIYNLVIKNPLGEAIQICQEVEKF